MPDKPLHPSLKAVPDELWRQFQANGGWRLLRRFALLWVYAASLFMLVAAPYELWTVYALRLWPVVAAHVTSVERVPPPFHDGPSHWEFRLTRDDTGAALVTADVRPGDLPLNILAWSTTDADARHYQPGQAVNIFVAPDGKRFFLEQGNPALMIIILAACLALWAWLILRIIRRPPRS